LVLEVVFIGLDRWAYPEHFAAFLTARLCVVVLALAVLFRWRFSHPKHSELGICIAVGAQILSMIYATGGATSEYFAGLIIVFVGMPVLQPLTARDALLICSIFIVGFMASPAIVSGDTDWRRFAIHSVFVLSGALESVVSCAVLTRSRLRDFEQREALEQARDALTQLDRAKSRFTANVHHELRTPLTLMLAPLESMLAGDFGEVAERQREYLRTMRVNGLRLLKLINNLLDLAKIESRQLELRRRTCAVGRVAEEVVVGARPLAERKGIVLATAGLGALPAVHADRDAVEKIVVNLVGNALKFTDAGGRIEVRGAPAAGGGVQLTVADTGIGLPPDQLGRIFDRFAQVDTSATRQHEGTGIGLSLAKELVEAHGGRIWAESEGLGHGTRMHVELPVGEADGEEEEEVLQNAAGESVALGRSLAAVQAEMNLATQDSARLSELEGSVERHAQRQLDAAARPDAGADAAPGDARPEVLIAEDNPDMRRLLEFVVGREFRVRTAPNGRLALEAVRLRAPDLVLTDVMMPEMSGTELCRALKSDPHTAGLPVVLVTSKAEREMKIEGLEGGADDYVTKPFHPRELLARVRALVRLRRLQTELEERNETLERMNVELERALSDLKEAEVQVLQSERLAAVGELAAGVAHEVNNPVNFALNALRTLGAQVDQLAEVARAISALDAAGDPEKLARDLAALEHERGELLPQEAPAELRELVAIVTEGLERTYRLVANLRDLAGGGGGVRTAVNLRRGLDSTLSLLHRDMQVAGIAVQIDLGPDPLVVPGDAGALNQLFLNLLKNSAEALAGTGGTIRIEGRRQGGQVVIRVRDSGPGIPAEVRERLFQPFFSTKEAGRGTGLGLSICRRIAADHGGSIELTSPPGEGAAFTLRLPAEGEPGNAA
jgi:signal transduction histidine kinase